MEGPSNGSSLYSCSGQAPSGSASSHLIALCYGVLIPLIVLGNGFVVTAFAINPKLRTATNIFICGLGLSDLLIGMFSVPYWTYISTLNSLMDAYCTPLYHVYICIDIGTGCASILQLTSIAIERLYFTVAPLKHRRLPRLVYWCMLAIAWIFATFAAGLQPLQDQSKWQDEYSLFLMITCFIFPLFIIITVYLYILKVGRDQAKKRPSTSTRMGSTGGYIKEFNIFVTVIVITGVFVIAWAPFFVTTVVANFCPNCLARPQGDHLVRFVKWMQYSSSAINPYIYAYRNQDVRASFKRIFRACLCGCLAKTKNKPSDNSRKSCTLNHMHRRKSENHEDSYGNSLQENRTGVENGHLAAPAQYPQTLRFDGIVLNNLPVRQHAPRHLKPKRNSNRALKPLSGQQARHSKTNSKQEDGDIQGQERTDQKERLNERMSDYERRHEHAHRPHRELSRSNPIPYCVPNSRVRSTAVESAKRFNQHTRCYDNPVSNGDTVTSYV